MEVLLESILSRRNLELTYSQVVSNKGAAGIDGMTVDELGDYLGKHWVTIRERITSGKYKPSVVRRVTIPKPNKWRGTPLRHPHGTGPYATTFD